VTERRRKKSITKSPNALVRCRDLVVGYEGHGLLPPIELSVDRGDVVLVVGRNGSGKSTWLKTLLGLLPPVSGTAAFTRPDLRRAYIPQAAALDDLLPVRAGTVVSWGRLRNWSFLRPRFSKDDRAACRDAAEHAEISDLVDQPFNNLSGGQRQRVLFARVLAGGAELVLADEPTASMDVAAERAAYDDLTHLAHVHGAGVVIVTHTLSVATQYADKMLFVDRGNRMDEPVAKFGTPADVCAHPLFQRYFGKVDVP
jgi:zinc transport system ATP-binding protein